MNLMNRLSSVLRKSPALQAASEMDVPLKGFEDAAVPTRYVDILSDEQLTELNSILRWNCFTADGKGRRFGRPDSPKKRTRPNPIPDRRIETMHEKFALGDKTVLEVGCFEGVHTVALAQRAKKVIAVDSRIENVVKTMVRVGFFGLPAQVFCCDLENVKPEEDAFLQADVVHHVGVLYHLKDPVTHLKAFKRWAPKGMMLDTHYAKPEMATQSYTVGGETFRYSNYREKGYADVFSGMYDHAKWLTIDDLKRALGLAGYANVEVAELRDERNGPRLLLFAKP